MTYHPFSHSAHPAYIYDYILWLRSFTSLGLGLLVSSLVVYKFLSGLTGRSHLISFLLPAGLLISWQLMVRLPGRSPTAVVKRIAVDSNGHSHRFKMFWKPLHVEGVKKKKKRNTKWRS